VNCSHWLERSSAVTGIVQIGRVLFAVSYQEQAACNVLVLFSWGDLSCVSSESDVSVENSVGPALFELASSAMASPALASMNDHVVIHWDR